MQIEDATIQWLMEGDPAIRWQVQKDLLDLPEEKCQQERQKVGTEGWGKRLLTLQDPAGTWAKGLYSPKWTSTTYTILLLIRLGLPRNNPQAHKAGQILLEKGFYTDGGINLFNSLSYSEMCVTGMVFKILCYFRIEDPRIHNIFEFIRHEQMADGGWNCEKPKGAIHSSFHTTISVLEGLWEYEQWYPAKKFAIHSIVDKAHEFLLLHHLFKSHRTGNIVDKKMARINFPPRWRYDFLRILDYFQARNSPKDPRMQDAVDLLQNKRKKTGWWNQGSNWAGRTFFDLEPVSEPGRMNTLRALRVLRWWDRNTPSHI
ncbi:MAG: hypothetical protein E4G98_00475 [Promethearchaeota archaeon]|nr:MAG: hypothetical protein E4G98_00475 [Candidatus Lokiarchaeota archaeon]